MPVCVDGESELVLSSKMRTIFASCDQFGQTDMNRSHSNEQIRKIQWTEVQRTEI